VDEDEGVPNERGRWGIVPFLALWARSNLPDYHQPRLGAVCGTDMTFGDSQQLGSGKANHNPGTSSHPGPHSHPSCKEETQKLPRQK
jgi:hypothetical protein